MTDKTKEGIVDLKDYKDKIEVPKELVEILRLLLDKTGNGKLRTIVAYFSYEKDDLDHTLEEETIIYHKDQNLIEVLGIASLLKTLITDMVLEESEEY